MGKEARRPKRGKERRRKQRITGKENDLKKEIEQEKAKKEKY